MNMTKAPILEEIKIPENIESIATMLSSFEISSRPLYLDARPLNYDQTQILLTTLRKWYKKRGIDPTLPFPLYIVTHLITKDPDFLIVEEPTYIPTHYLRQTGRLTRKEQHLLEKIDLLVERGKALNFLEKKQKLKTLFKNQRLLLQTCSTIDYYEGLFNKIEGND